MHESQKFILGSKGGTRVTENFSLSEFTSVYRRATPLVLHKKLALAVHDLGKKLAEQPSINHLAFDGLSCSIVAKTPAPAPAPASALRPGHAYDIRVRRPAGFGPIRGETIGPSAKVSVSIDPESRETSSSTSATVLAPPDEALVQEAQGFRIAQ